MVRPCELKVQSLRKQVTRWRRQHLKPVSKMRLKELELQFDKFEDLLDYLPDGSDVVRAPVARKAISKYRRQHHPPVGKMGRDDVVVYMAKYGISPASGERLKRDKCDVRVDDEVTLRDTRRRRGIHKHDAEIERGRKMAAKHREGMDTGAWPPKTSGRPADMDAEIARLRKKLSKRRVTPQPAKLSKGKLKNKARKPFTTFEVTPDFEQRAAALDAADSSLAW